MRDLKIFTDNIEYDALAQINALLELETFASCKIRIMPDVHAGVGCVIGFTANLGDKVIPNLVGVDIGCGVIVAPLGKVDINLEQLDQFVNNEMCYGLQVNNKVLVSYDLKKLRCYKQLSNIPWIEKSLGSLGSGNHFIEIDESENGEKYIVIHSGSRNLGLQVAKIYQKLAIKLRKEAPLEERAKIIESLKAQGRQADIPDALQTLTERYKNETKLSPDLCYLDGKEREDYLHDMRICQDWAKLNRKTMIMQMINHLLKTQKLKFLQNPEKNIFEVVHNYIGDDNIIRKGSISARLGEKVLIPLNMRDGCILGIGKGNEDWNYSAPHGAGRLISRSAAKQLISLDEYSKSMQGIYTSTVNHGTIDEAPAAYKPMAEIVEKIQDTVEIIEVIKPIYNFKAQN